MTLTESKIQENKRNIAERAIKGFYEQGIEQTKISEIANDCRIGVVTVYRYFGTKAGLVIAATELLWERLTAAVDTYFDERQHNGKTGLMQVSDCLELYLHLYKKRRQYYRYLYEFINFLGTDEALHIEYEDLQKKITFIEPYFLAAVEKGKSDGTICASVDGPVTYRSISNFITGVAQKVYLFDNDTINPGSAEAEFEVYNEMVLCYLRGIKP